MSLAGHGDGVGVNLDSESETESDDVVEIMPEVIEEQKKQKQSQITDFFRSKKYFFFLSFWFVPYKSRDNFPKNDDLFPIEAEDCTRYFFEFCKKSFLRI